MVTILLLKHFFLVILMYITPSIAQNYFVESNNLSLHLNLLLHLLPISILPVI